MRPRAAPHGCWASLLICAVLTPSNIFAGRDATLNLAKNSLESDLPAVDTKKSRPHHCHLSLHNTRPEQQVTVAARGLL